jgi:hypothetical protein
MQTGKTLLFQSFHGARPLEMGRSKAFALPLSSLHGRSFNKKSSAKLMVLLFLGGVSKLSLRCVTAAVSILS